jgi:antitoxin (DNA-binding transcriptional repressor) of toxin-antitoxin stability system
MAIISLEQVESNLSRLIKGAGSGREIIMARGGKPVARLVPFGEAKRKRKPGSLKGKLRVGSEFFSPLPPEQIASWE